MTLAVSPSPKMSSITKGAEVSFTLDLTGELDGNVVDIYTFKIFDNAGGEVTPNFGGGDAIADGIITFGIKAYDIGSYTIEFWVTCIEVLPDTVTPNEFFVEMSFVVVA